MAKKIKKDREAKALDDQQLENVSGGVRRLSNGEHDESVRPRRRNSQIEKADEFSLVQVDVDVSIS